MGVSIFSEDGSALRPELERAIDLACSHFYRRRVHKRETYEDLLQYGRMIALERRDKLEQTTLHKACGYLFNAVRNYLIREVAQYGDGKIRAPNLRRSGDHIRRFPADDEERVIPARLSREVMRECVLQALERPKAGARPTKIKKIVPLLFEGKSFAECDKILGYPSGRSVKLCAYFAVGARNYAIEKGLVKE